MASNPSDRLDCTRHAMSTNPCRKVRVVAKIRGFTPSEVESSKPVSWISVNKPKGEASENVSISFREQSALTAGRKESYLVDYCFEQDEDNAMIFTREVKPLISRVLEGHNATIFAYGARGSGKTHVIQGTGEESGLVVLAMAEIFSMVEENAKSVSISFYEVDQDHACDALAQGRPTIQVLEDRGKIHFKGLSQVPVKSISEFQKIYFMVCAARKSAHKTAAEPSRRTHMGLVVHVSSKDGKENTHVGKMAFVDLAGYEDPRRRIGDERICLEISKINKSVYVLLNVVYALSTNESRVAYRESKLTRILQDTLGGSSRILMVACLNPTFCQDSMYMVSLASRSCQGIHRPLLDSTKKSKNSGRLMMPSSQKSQIHRSVSANAKTLTSSCSNLSKNKSTNSSFVMKGRILFQETSSSTKPKKASSFTDAGNSMESNSTVKKEASPLPTTEVTENIILNKENSSSDATDIQKCNFIVEMEATPLATSGGEKNAMLSEDISTQNEDHHEEHTPSINSCMKALSFVEEGHIINKDNQNLPANEDRSPPISARLLALSNSLKSLPQPSPLCLKVPEEGDSSFSSQIPTDVEPKTPAEQSMRANERLELTNVSSPWQTFSMRSSGMKNSLVQEYLRFLNTANKEELKKLKGIGEKRAAFILELREESPEPFKSLGDLKDIGLSAKQIKGIMKREVAELFN